jgi:hypothetical protein
VIPITKDNNEVALPGKLLRQSLYLSHQRARGVDHRQAQLIGALSPFRRRSVRGNRYLPKPLSMSTIYRFRSRHSRSSEAFHYLGVMNDVTNRRDPIFGLPGALNNFECSSNAPTVPHRIGKDDLAFHTVLTPF